LQKSDEGMSEASGMAKPDPAQTRKIQEEALIHILMSIRGGSRTGGSSQPPGPGLQRRIITSWGYSTTRAERKYNAIDEMT
jgi:hypothetical protein